MLTYPRRLHYCWNTQLLSWASRERFRSYASWPTTDSTGITYTLSAHTLPSARSLGAPLSSRFNIQDSASFPYTLTGDTQQKVILASSFGYGFVTALENLHSRVKAGKAMLSVRAGAIPVMPALIKYSGRRDGSQTVICATSDGYLRMGAKDIEHFRGERAPRGRKLPRGFQRVTKIELAGD